MLIADGFAFYNLATRTIDAHERITTALQRVDSAIEGFRQWAECQYVRCVDAQSRLASRAFFEQTEAHLAEMGNAVRASRPALDQAAALAMHYTEVLSSVRPLVQHPTVLVDAATQTDMPADLRNEVRTFLLYRSRGIRDSKTKIVFIQERVSNVVSKKRKRSEEEGMVENSPVKKRVIALGWIAEEEVLEIGADVDWVEAEIKKVR